MQDKLTDILTEVRSALRFRWYGMIAVWLVCLAGWAYVARMPDVYESSARVFVDTNSVLQGVLGDNSANVPEVQDRIIYIREALLGRVRLETVMAEARLHPTDGAVLVEEGWPGADALANLGFTIESRERTYFARLNAVEILSDGTFRGVGEPRWSESAAGGPR